MKRLPPAAPAPIALRLHVAATLLLLLQLGFVLEASAVTGGLRTMTWTLGLVAAAAFGAALLAGDPARAGVGRPGLRGERASRRAHRAPRHTVSALLASAVSAFSLPGVARADTVTIGRTWPIAELDALAEIEGKVATLPRDLSKRYGPRSGWSALRAAPLGVAEADRVRTVVPFHTLEFDITLPDGRVLYPKGFTFNPLSYVSLPQRLVIVQPRDLAWALQVARPSDFILLTAGDAIAQSERTGRAIYILEERVKARLGLTVAPVIVAQVGQKLELTEVGPKGREQHATAAGVGS